MITDAGAGFDLAIRLRQDGIALADAFAFVSGLYFRGKYAYASAFAAPPLGAPGALVIAAGRGLLAPETLVRAGDLLELASVPIDLADRRYRDTLERDALSLCKSLDSSCEVVLLGSIATSKYLEPLLDVFGRRLLVPADFIGRGDMSRGSLMLRCARDRVELDYIPAASALRRGERPPRRPKLV